MGKGLTGSNNLEAPLDALDKATQLVRRSCPEYETMPRVDISGLDAGYAELLEDRIDRHPREIGLHKFLSLLGIAGFSANRV